jgi:ribonuclease HII
VIGIDEVGRGALAGPVVVVAALVPARRSAWLTRRALRECGPLKDSKKLTPAQREAWCAQFKNNPETRFAAARIYPRGIERLNISRAANRAAGRALAGLVRNYGIELERTQIFLDGGLFVDSRKAQEKLLPRAATVVKADEKIPAVAAASIVAKVSRDRFMAKLARRYPSYLFDVHKGYGTKVHRAALAKAGPCDAHRLTFIAPRPILNGTN